MKRKSKPRKLKKQAAVGRAYLAALNELFRRRAHRDTEEAGATNPKQEVEVKA